jgi:hypothetical protein
MAFALATQILNDGPRNTVAKVTGDMAPASYPTGVVILDPSLLTGMNPGMSGTSTATLLRLDHVDYSIGDGTIVQLIWDATTPVVIAELYGRGKLESKMFGGYQNNAGAGVTGKILLTAIASGAVTPTEASIFLLLATVKYRSITIGGA